MDPFSITCSLLPVIQQFLNLILKTYKAGWVRSSEHCKDELQLFMTELEKQLQLVEQVEKKADAVGFKCKCLDKLHDELRELLSSAKNLLSGKKCKKGDIQKLRERVNGKLEHYVIAVEVGVEIIKKFSEGIDVQGMACDKLMELLSRVGVENNEMQSKICEGVKALSEMMTKKQDEQAMVSKNHIVQINIFQLGQACDNQMLIDELITRVLEVPTEALKHKASPYVYPALPIRSGFLEESSALNEGAAKYRPKKEVEMDFLTKEATGKDVLEEKGRKKAFVMKDKEGKDKPREEEEEGVGEEEERSISEGHGEDLFLLLMGFLLVPILLLLRFLLGPILRKEGSMSEGHGEEDAGKDVLEEEKGRKEAVVKDMEREDVSKEKDKNKSNPNRNEDVSKEEEEEKEKIKKEEEKEKDRNKDEAHKEEKKIQKEGSSSDGHGEEDAGKDVLEERKGRKEAVEKDMEREDVSKEEEEKEKNKSNPNRNVELEDCKGKGKLDLSKLEGGRFQLIYKWHKEYSMRIVIGSSSMKVSEELGCGYFEVKLVKMQELGREMGMSCVGVGLASQDEFQMHKMAGKYSKSCGYVGGGVGEVYSENRVQNGRHRMGILEEKDTLGIGLLRLHGDKHCIFFTRNGNLKDCVQDSYIHKIACDGGFIPVISLASAHVQLYVNFHGPFRQLSDLVTKVKARYKYMR